jgi:hypothetical protein
MTNQLSLRYRITRLAKLPFLQLRSWLLRVGFEFSKRQYIVREFMFDRRGDANILQALARTTFFSFLFSFAFLLLFFLLPFPEVQEKSIDNYDNFLIAVASITGIFLSLYFTSLSTVIGGLYAKSPKPVRELLIQERVNHFSVRFLVFLTILCLELLAVGLLFENRPISSVFLVALFGCFAVLFFAELGRRAFYFFDPSLFANQLHSEILKWAKSSGSKGYRFGEPSFQDFYRKKAESAIAGFQGLIELAKTEVHLKETLDEITSEIQRTYNRYLFLKQTIPTKSRWFLYSPKFQDWFIASNYIVQMASLAQADIPPENKPNHEWLEDRLETLELDALAYALDQGNWEATKVILGNLFDQFHILGRACEISRATKFLERLQIVIEKSLTPPNIAPIDWGDEKSAQRLGTLQVLDGFLVTMTAGLSSSLEKINVDDLKKDISKQNWNKYVAPYNLGLPFGLLERAEYLRDRLMFEKDAEGKIVSPPWYISELIFQQFSFFLEDAIQVVSTNGLAFFENRVSKYEGEKRLVDASIVASDALEMEAKVRRFTAVAKRLSESLDTERSIEGLSWATWTWEKIDERLNDFHTKMILAQISHMGSLFTRNQSTDLPDYFGKSVIFAGEECIKSLDANNAELFSKLFERYFGGILLVFEKIRAKSADLKPEPFLLLLAEPIMDLFYVSGLSLLYAEFHQNPALFQPCKLAWEKLAGGQKEYLELLAIVVKNKNYSFGITNRDSTRTQWEMNFNRKIRSLPKRYEDLGSITGGRSVADHKSELIQVVGGYDELPTSMFDPSDIFIDLFLCGLPEAGELDFGLRHKVSESISRRKEARRHEQEIE